jgi:arabinofuranosyltransferase
MLDAWRRKPPAARGRAALVVLVAVAAVVEAGLHVWSTDDIFITLRYCDNVLAGHGPVYNVGERTEGYTHFLWFALLTVGRALGIGADWLACWLPVPAFVGCLVWLVRLSGRLWPERGGLYGIPVAMLAWALHEDARRFASSGLETAAFTWALLAGVLALVDPDRAARGRRAAWAFAIATLLRPEGMLYSLLAGVTLLWGDRDTRRAARDFALVWLVLVLPLFVFRWVYYGWPLPNAYYAKSGSGAYWPQGWVYTRMYFATYPALLAAPLAVPAVAAWLRAADPTTRWHGRVLVFVAAAAALTILYVTRVGGDFMFARFFIPTTPLLLLLIEAAVQRLPRPRWRLVAFAACCALILFGAVRKRRLFGPEKEIHGIVDESKIYPPERLRYVRAAALSVRDCLAGTRATIQVQGAQAQLAYFARFPIAIETFGLTDATIAHQPLVRRGRPGHEKMATTEYLYERGVNMRFDWQPRRYLPQYTLFQLGNVYGNILVYDRALMDHLKSCPNARFFDFPLWLAHDYIPSVPTQLRTQLLEDWSQFHHFYFAHNPDPEGLREKLRRALATAGIQNPPIHPPVIPEDPRRTRSR